MVSEVVIKDLVMISSCLFLDPKPMTRTQGGCQLVFIMLGDATWADGGETPPMILFI